MKVFNVSPLHLSQEMSADTESGQRIISNGPLNVYNFVPQTNKPIRVFRPKPHSISSTNLVHIY